MQKLTFNINVLWMTVILLSTLSMYGMEKDHTQSALKATEYNNAACPLTSLPKETLTDIFSHCLINEEDQVKSLAKSIKSFMQMNTACKKFNTILSPETIGEFHKNYTTKVKKTFLEKLIQGTYRGYKSRKIPGHDYESRRLPGLILVYANANMEMYNNLLIWAVSYDDTQLATILFEHHADPNAQALGETPIFFGAKTIKMAQIFIDNGINVHATNGDGKNVLWQIVDYEIPSEVIALYLNEVNVRTFHQPEDSCLLHYLIHQAFHVDNIDDRLKIGTLFLNVAPDLVNKLNKKGKTPIDVAQEYLAQGTAYVRLSAFIKPYLGQEERRLSALFKHYNCATALKKYIALLKRYGGKTGKEIQEASMILLLHNDDDLGDLSLLPRDVRRGIVQYMMNNVNK